MNHPLLIPPLAVLVTGLVFGQEQPGSQTPGTAPARDAVALLEEIDDLRAEVEALRGELAQAKLDAAAAQRELEELRQFIHDHQELEQDFERYQAIKAIAERESRRREAEEIRQRREAEAAERARRMDAARAERAADNAQATKQARYRQAGFTSLGLDVYVGRMAFFYSLEDRSFFDVKYDPLLGSRYLKPYPQLGVDYSSMTISGTVLNAAEEVRNIGIAVTFFDEAGNQVGGEIIQLKNARPEVPYPFTATPEMALDRPFSSSSTYVLYADPAAPGQPAPDPQG